MHRRNEDYDRALPLFQGAITMKKAAVAARGEGRVGPMDAMGGWAGVCSGVCRGVCDRTRVIESTELSRTKPEHPRMLQNKPVLAGMLNNFATLYRDMDKLDQAITHVEEVGWLWWMKRVHRQSTD